MKIPKSALLSVVFVLLILSFIFSVTSNYNYSTTGYVSVPTNITTFSLSLTVILIIVFMVYGSDYYDQGDHIEGLDDEKSYEMAYPAGSKPLHKIFQITRAYISRTHLGSKYGKSDPEYFINRVRPYIKDMLEDPGYLRTVPAIRKTLEGIYKRDFKNDKEGAKKYLEELNREFNELFASYG